MNSESEQASDQERIVKACEQLGEYFETVHIFCTRVETDGTRTHSHGSGNWFARYGQIRTWIIKQDEFSKAQCHRENENE